MEQQEMMGAPATTERRYPYRVTFRLQTFTVHDPHPEDGSIHRQGSSTRSAEDAARLARTIYADLDADKEHFVVFCLNNKNRLNGFKIVSTGSLTASLVHPREVYTAALELRAAALIFVHNHPSGDPQPSPEDIEITRRLKEVGEVIGIRVLDHIVLGHDRYFSFSERGIL